MIPPEFVQQLLSRIDIAEVVGAHVELRKTGGNLLGLCPFHGEKSPSFTVSPSKQFYHCFGCGAHGDALRFITEYQGLGFVEAVQELARRVGMEVPSDPRSAAQREQAAQAKAQRKGLSELLAQAQRHYAKELRDHPRAIEYLKGRGLSGQVAADFGIGFAPPGWRSLARCFPAYDEPDLVSAGLVIESGEGEEEASQKRYDRFRDRIMFPIRNVTGEVIGFGGRVLGKGEPKYLNSPETPVFNKGTELYGLFEARSAIRQRGYALVVEGYMDVVALAQHGLRHAVATLGTACTAEHVAKLFRFTEQIVFSFDGDAAGRRAAARALQSSLPHLNEKRTARFLFLPTEHDPDTFVREFGAEAFEGQVERAQAASGYLLELAQDGCRLDAPEGRARLLAQAKPMWLTMPESLLRRQLLGEIARLARLPEAELLESWSGRTSPPPASGDGPQARPRRPQAPRRMTSALRPDVEVQVLRLLLVHAAWWERLDSSTHERLLNRDTPASRLLSWLDRHIAEHGPPHWAALRPMLLADPALLEAQQQLPRLDLAALDFQATLETPFEDLERLLERIDQPDHSAVLGRSAPGLRR
ncbi:MAG: DNA primase [Burkholderiales bacterium]|uniref:DNA primase n=1 Tax=Inhella sp. TaxID=1921806 RepID=UPI001AC8C1E0|nr:DNA primase [Burkholderiales bacterium]